MFTIVDSELTVLLALGKRLKQRRLERNDRQSDAAARLGVSLATYRKMEVGNSSIPIAYWLRMIRLYGDVEQLATVLDEKKTLFDQLAAEKSTKKDRVRKRARQ